MTLVLDVSLLLMLLVTAVAIACTRDLFAAVMLAGIYGLLSASFFVVMDAVDVAFTEAAVGAGVFPLLMLTTLGLAGRHETGLLSRPWMSLGLVTACAAVLVLGTLDMPPFASPESAPHQHVAMRYLQQSDTEIGIPNVVTSVLASYRAYDTLGEVVVIFTATVGVLCLLAPGAQGHSTDQTSYRASMHEHRILRVVSKVLIPLILLFALYVQFHGEYSPGGGFQAGVIFSAAIILYAMVFGLQTAIQAFNPRVLRVCVAAGVLIFGGTGLLSLLSGENYLDYAVLARDAVTAQHLGILLVELGVGITVAASMILVFFAFAGFARDARSEAASSGTAAVNSALTTDASSVDGLSKDRPGEKTENR